MPHGRSAFSHTGLAGRKELFNSPEESLSIGCKDLKTLITRKIDKDLALSLFRRLQEGDTSITDECFHAWLPVVYIFKQKRKHKWDDDEEEILQLVCICLLHILTKPKDNDLDDWNYVLRKIRIRMKYLRMSVKKEVPKRLSCGSVPQVQATLGSHRQAEDNIFIKEIFHNFPEVVASTSRFSQDYREVISFIVNEFVYNEHFITIDELAKHFAMEPNIASFLIQHSFVLARLKIQDILKHNAGMFDREWRWRELQTYFDEAEFEIDKEEKGYKK